MSLSESQVGVACCCNCSIAVFDDVNAACQLRLRAFSNAELSQPALCAALAPLFELGMTVLVKSKAINNATWSCQIAFSASFAVAAPVRTAPMYFDAT
jgi:hypothetical protein